MNQQRFGKTLAMVEMSKHQQAKGKRVYWATLDQQATAEMLTKHGALSEVVGSMYLRPYFRKEDRG